MATIQRRVVAVPLVLVTLLSVSQIPALADTYVIHPDGTGDYPTIEAAIDAAIHGDIVELVDGTFTGEGNRDLDFSGKNLMLRSRSDDPTACIIDCEAVARGIQLQNGETTDAVLRGITITNAVANDGAGLRIIGASPTVTHCRFIDNRATGATWGGGGVLVEISSSAPVFTDVVFRGNEGGRGAGMLVRLQAAPLLDNVLFIDNRSTSSGAGLYCETSSGTRVVGCTFAGNSASGGMSGAIACRESSITIDHTTISGNQGLMAGGIQCYDSSPSITNTIIVGSINSRAIWCYRDSNPTLSCCLIHGNDVGDWIECIEDQAGIDGNASADPQFCSTLPDEDENWTLQSDSPCAPDLAPGGCDVVGAWGTGCATTVLTPTTWGAIKAAF